MKKYAVSISIATLLLAGVTGCGNNDPADVGANNFRGPETEQGAVGQTRPFGGAVIDQSRETRTGMFYGQRADQTGQGGNGALSGQGIDQNGRGGNGAFGTQGLGRSGQGQSGRNLGNRTGNNQDQSRMNYHADYDGQTVQRLVDRIESIDGVEEARALIHGDDVIVAVTTEENNVDIRDEIERTASGLANGNNVIVVTDKETIRRIRSMDNQLRGGTPFDQIGTGFSEIMNDLNRETRNATDRNR
ncbi:hypothetical protein J2S74_000095 [Evansella vedderi]|uniref:Uncharacterized protein n=1 Tax=Evansella vedderi TaxID=38282 RepID=A0ABT9ZNB5_9BACI|nr:YhcN/YlaJ family sporulation lipoprotein [Evansella vedderi]MDQ0252723.1 hypothetical protein [Evansella vedderi]